MQLCKKRFTLVFLLALIFVFPILDSTEVLAVDVGYDGGFYIKTDDGDYKLKTNFQLQPQYQFTSIEGQGKVNTFQLRRARVAWSGNVFGQDTTYKFQFEACGGTVSTAIEGVARCGPNLRDAWMDYRFSDAIAITFGQFKPAHNREELTSSSELQFVDRSINNEVFSYNRALGVQLHGGLLDKTLEWALYGVNDPTAQGQTNLNNELAFGGRLVWNIMGEHGYTMSDIQGHEDPALALGVHAGLNFPAVAGDDPTLIASGLDLVLMYAGFSFLGETNYIRNQTASTDIIGILGQLGYFLIPEKFEIVARGSAVIPKGAGTNGYETGVGLNYFLRGHHLKLQADYSLLWNSPLVLNVTNAPVNIINTGGLPGFVQNQNDHRVRVQAQLYF